MCIVHDYIKTNVVKTVANYYCSLSPSTSPKNACTLSRTLVTMCHLLFQSSCCETVVYVLHRKFCEHMLISNKYTTSIFSIFKQDIPIKNTCIHLKHTCIVYSMSFLSNVIHVHNVSCNSLMT